MSREASVAAGKHIGVDKEEKKTATGKIDYITMVLPLLFVVIMSVIFMAKPEQSEYYLGIVRTFIGDDCGLYYSIIAGGVFLTTMYMAFSKIGKIKLGAQNDKKAFSDFKWGTMIFTSTMGADILFYSLSEWSMYASDDYIKGKGVEEWASTYPLFHWGPLAWGLYIVLAVAFGYMINVKKCDYDTGACTPQGGATFEGIPIEVRNAMECLEIRLMAGLERLSIS